MLFVVTQHIDQMLLIQASFCLLSKANALKCKKGSQDATFDWCLCAFVHRLILFQAVNIS